MNSATPNLSLTRHFFCIACLAALFLAWLPTPAQAQDQQGNGASADVQAIAQAINAQRASAGLPPLTLHPLLNLAAQNHVNDMIANHVYGHTGSDGSYVRQRVERVGYASGGWVSENWVSANSPDGAMQWWMNDWIHRENILNPHWRELGVGIGQDPSGGMIFVTDFTAGSDGQTLQIDNVQASVAPPEPLAIPTGGIDYTIQPGDTLLAIAYRYGIDWVMIAEANRINGETLLQIGQVIHLPGVEGVGGQTDEQPEIKAAADSTESTSTEPTKFTGTKKDAAKDQKEDAAPLPPTQGFVRLYTVQPGNTLGDIAQLYGVSWKALAEANGLQEDSLLDIGEELRIPDVIQDTKAETTTQTTADEPQATEATTQASRYHEVQDGETIITIAGHYGLDWQELLRLNHLKEDTILQPGEKIRLQ